MPRLIDADALMEFARNHIDGRIDCNDIARFPTIEADPVRHGRWIKKPTTIKYISHSECSLCGSWQGADWMNYCPHCGAKMSGGDEDGQK